MKCRNLRRCQGIFFPFTSSVVVNMKISQTCFSSKSENRKMDRYDMSTLENEIK